MLLLVLLLLRRRAMGGMVQIQTLPLRSLRAGSIHLFGQW